MISKELFLREFDQIITNGLREDIVGGDISSLACISSDSQGVAKLFVKEDCVIAGVTFAKMTLQRVDPNLQIDIILKDGDIARKGDIAFTVSGSQRSILKAERFLLNSMQRMSAIASKTNIYVQLIEGTSTRLLDTRKTTPGIRAIEKWAVRIGGGYNHRFALFDMVMLKDNHIKAVGDITKAVEKTFEYLQQKKLNLKVIVEVKSLQEIKRIIDLSGIYRILLDNFEVSQMKEAIDYIGGSFQTEASGNISESTIRDYANTGVDYISCGAITHSVHNVDLSLKII